MESTLQRVVMTGSGRVARSGDFVCAASRSISARSLIASPGGINLEFGRAEDIAACSFEIEVVSR